MGVWASEQTVRMAESSQMKTDYHFSRRSFLLTSALTVGLTGCAKKEETVSGVYLYDFRKVGNTAAIGNAVIIEKKPGYIKLRVGEQVIEHSGRYTIQTQVEQ